VSVSARNPQQDLLELFGFPLILSSELRLFNRLREKTAAQFFSDDFLRVGGSGTGSEVLGRQKQNHPSAKLILISDFLQEIVSL
jgi:hypothetical protein